MSTTKQSKKLNKSSIKGQEVQKRTIFKPLLTNPYTKKNVWPRIEPTVQVDLLQILETDTLQPLRIWNSFTPEERKLSNSTEHENIITRFNSIMEKLEEQVKSNPETSNPITALFVCRYDIPCKLTYKHLPTLCQLANVKLITLPKGSAKKLAKVTNSKHDIQFLALHRNAIPEKSFLALTIDSTVEDVKIGFLENYENQKLNMNVKYILTEMPIKKKQPKKT
ncbi:hypothetical protein CANINC_005055 [Pichia inconspicua]|uniref:Ribosomal protein L7Ae/L30e/S12e/Gadd45 domain-containing protein n=1 Tax=Pichia inconspicua TaxID=52247 RepID=A0A4T0WVM4_9ASCO|nr:hypothetical protein CANINC_005055 [[Candida] inconspicua]